MLEFLVRVVFILVMVVIIALIGGIPVWLLWNWLVPDIFGLRSITLYEAIGLLLLTGFLFKSSVTSSSRS